jgi:hypothetical protein
MYELITHNTFPDEHHTHLQHLWLNAHYKVSDYCLQVLTKLQEDAHRRGRILHSVDRFRVRQKHPIPKTIRLNLLNPRRQFSKETRAFLKNNYRHNPHPDKQTRILLSYMSDLTTKQARNILFAVCFINSMLGC